MPSTTHSRTRSKRLRTTEEPPGLEGGAALSGGGGCSSSRSRRRGLAGGPLGPKVRRSQQHTTCTPGEEEEEEEQEEEEEEEKEEDHQNSLRLPGKRLTGAGTRMYCLRPSLSVCLSVCLSGFNKLLMGLSCPCEALCLSVILIEYFSKRGMFGLGLECRSVNSTMLSLSSSPPSPPPNRPLQTDVCGQGEPGRERQTQPL